MAKILRSFRFRMIQLFGLSMLCAAVITYMLYKALQRYYYTTKVEDPLTKIRYFVREIGDVNVFLLIFIPQAIYFFFLQSDIRSISISIADATEDKSWCR